MVVDAATRIVSLIYPPLSQRPVMAKLLYGKQIALDVNMEKISVMGCGTGFYSQPNRPYIMGKNDET